MNILDPAYIKLWFQIAFPFILILAVVLVPLFGIWYELHKRRKNDERDYTPLPYPTREEIDDAIDNRLQ
jgi:hypothetical protein